jgi:putative membrane protein
MIADHGRTLAGLRQAAIASGLTAPPKALSGDQSSLLAALQSLRGEAFDRTYLRQQALVHDQALAVTRSYASFGPDGPVRKAAQATAPLIQRHLETAEALRAGLGGS